MNRIESLIINVTDICNMECRHCLRGDGQGRKIDLSLIPRIFEGIDEIDCITITGGEPGCYVEAVQAIVDYLVKNEDSIHVRGFFIVTNAKEYHQELVDAVKTMLLLHLEKDWGTHEMVAGKEIGFYADCMEEEIYQFAIAVSLDEFHEPIPLSNWFKYRFSGVYSNSKQTDYSKGGVIARGRGSVLPGATHRMLNSLYVEKEDDGFLASEVYVTVEGYVFGDCNMSYEMEEFDESAGDLEEETLAEILQRIAGEEED